MFEQGVPVRGISRNDEEWHNGVVERFEGKLLVVKFNDT